MSQSEETSVRTLNTFLRQARVVLETAAECAARCLLSVRMYLKSERDEVLLATT
jgi:hypothetical protein